MFTWISNLFRVCLGEVWASNELAYSGCAHLPRLLLYLFKQTAILMAECERKPADEEEVGQSHIATAAAGQSLRF
jgi:hypothetical protein